MPFKAVSSQNAPQSLLPIYGEKKTKFIFWDAIQMSNTMSQYSGLSYVKFLGEGVTFTVNLHTEPDSSNKKPKLVAVKTAKLTEASFTSDGPGVDLYSLLLEIQILRYPPLQAHPNIIDVLGMDWTVIGRGVPTPRIIVEYARFGTMSDFLKSESVALDEKIDLCLDIASGLEMVHRCEVIHGDLKLPNILVFEGQERRRLAKISDFGCALTSVEIREGRRYGGTKPYRAPELRDDFALSLEDLKRCDVFAFGLCVWEILKNGDTYAENDAFSTAMPVQPEMRAGKPLHDVFDTFLDSIFTNIPKSNVAFSGNRQAGSESKTSLPLNTGSSTLRHHIHDLVCRSIHAVPAKRCSMPEVIQLLRKLAKPRTHDPNAVAFPFRRANVGVWGLSNYTNIPRDAQREAVATLQASLKTASKDDKGRILLMLSECNLHGYGVKSDPFKALDYLEQAAVVGSISAEAVLLRITDAVNCAKQTPAVSCPAPSSVRAFQVRSVFKDLEGSLQSLDPGQNYSSRLREWTHMVRATEEEAGFSLKIDGLDMLQVCPGTADNLLQVIESNQGTNVGTAVVTCKSEFGSGNSEMLLHVIASHGWIELLKSLTAGTQLLHENMPVYQNHGDVSNPGNLIIAAAANGQAQMIKFLLESGVSPGRWEGELSPSSWLSGLHFLFMFEDGEIEEVANLLIAHGADPNLFGQQTLNLATLAHDFPFDLNGPPLNTAVATGDCRAVRILLKNGADPLLRSDPGDENQVLNCLDLAVALHLYEIVDLILVHLGATTPDPRSLLPRGILSQVSGLVLGGKGIHRRMMLHGSQYKEACHKTIQTLLKYGVSIEEKDDDGYTPLQASSYSGPCQRYVLEALLENHADPNCRNKAYSVPLMDVSSTVWDPEDNAEATKSLLQFGADVNASNNAGESVIHYHASSNSTASLEVVIEAGASLKCEDNEGLSPVFSAVRNGGVESMTLLLQKGAEINSHLGKENPQKVTSLPGFAILFGQTNVVRALLDKGAPIHRTEGGPETILNIATEYGQPEIIRLLVQDYGSLFCKPTVLNAMNEKGQTPLEGSGVGGPSLIDRMLQAGADLDFRDPGRLESSTALAAMIRYDRLDSALYLLEVGASVYCRGEPHEQMWSFLNEVVYHCGAEPRLGPKFAGFLQSSRKWIDEHQLLSVRNWAGQTILQSAVLHGQLVAVKALVEFGASLEDRLDDLRLTYWSDTNFFWRRYHVKGIDIVNFAVLLRNSTRRQKEAWESFIPFEITTQDMDDIIEYLVEVTGGSIPKLSMSRRLKNSFKRISG